MDSASRQIFKQNEKLIKDLDMSKLRPHLISSKMFTKPMLIDIYDPSCEIDLFSELPTRGPFAFIKFLDILEKSGYHLEASKLKNAPKYVETSRVKLVFYSMQSQPIGYCVIINNVHFDVLPEREGSDVDAKELEKLFKSIGFVVETKHNLEGKKMKMYLRSIAKSNELKSVDCCFVIILSHGYKNGVIYGTDSYELPKDEIQAMFNSVNCKNLKDKPKIFLYQACRGSDEDHGVDSADSSSEIESEHDDNDTIGDVTDAIPTNFIASSARKNASVMKKDPSVNDILIVHSSLPDHKAYRDHYRGSWFIQDIVSVFSRDHKVHDLENMLKTVNRKIQERLSQKGQKKQVPHIENMGLRALLHLCSNDDYEGCNISSREYLQRP